MWQRTSSSFLRGQAIFSLPSNGIQSEKVALFVAPALFFPGYQPRSYLSRVQNPLNASSRRLEAQRIQMQFQNNNKCTLKCSILGIALPYSTFHLNDRKCVFNSRALLGASWVSWLHLCSSANPFHGREEKRTRLHSLYVNVLQLHSTSKKAGWNLQPTTMHVAWCAMPSKKYIFKSRTHNSMSSSGSSPLQKPVVGHFFLILIRCIYC